jgi:RNA polymerase sigma-70 factor (ECF subfamily)
MSLSQETDENLMLRFGRGDAAAFEALYRRHELRIYRYLYRNVRNEASANDLMQEVWFAVANNAQRYRPTAKFSTWLFTLAHHRMVDMIRGTRAQQSLNEQDSENDSTTLQDRLPADSSAEPEVRAQARDEAAALLSAVERLPPEQRAAFLMQAEGELSMEEIAAATGTTFETVKSRLRYARAKLRQLLLEFA